MYAKTTKIYYTPRKLRLVAALIRGKKAEEASEYLRNVNKKGSVIVGKTLKSAISNAMNQGVNPADLTVSEVRVDESLKIKRIFAGSRGRSSSKTKRYSTLTVKLK